LLPLLREVNPFYTIQRPFVMLHFNNIVSSTHMSFRWFHQRLQRILPKSASCVPFHNCLTFSVPRLPPDTNLHNHRLSVFRSCLSITRHYQLSSISGRRPPILVNMGPIERRHNTAERKVFTEAEFRSVYMEWGYLTVDTMNAAGKQREIFLYRIRHGASWTWSQSTNARLKVILIQILKHRLKEGIRKTFKQMARSV